MTRAAAAGDQQVERLVERRRAASSSSLTSMRRAWKELRRGGPAGGRRRARPSGRLGQLGGGVHGRAATMARRCARAWRSSPSRAGGRDSSSLGPGVHDVLGRDPASAGSSPVHAHVERAVVAVAEAPVGLVDLRGADAEVEEHAADLGRAERRRPPRRAGRSGRGGRWPGPRTARGGRAAAMASGSRSMPTRERAGLASRTAAAWPPSPSVASTGPRRGRRRTPRPRGRP